MWQHFGLYGNWSQLLLAKKWFGGPEMLKKGVEGQKMQEMPLSANEIFRPLRGGGVEEVRS